MEATDGTDATVRLAETHISILIFTGERVYKIHKPVRFEFLDFRDRADRAADCHREVELNRRLSPDVYLGVADLVMDGEPVEHIVVMRALPDERQLEYLLCSGGVIETRLDSVAATLSAFHATAARSAEISASASPSALEHKWEENFEEVTRLVNTRLDPSVETEVRGLVARWLSTHRALLETRIADGQICDGHGDLQASDIFCLDDGVRILDCLEFSDTLRWDDVCADVAFLAMDLERLGRPDAARMFVRAYERHSGARLPPSLLHLHIALRAVRQSQGGMPSFRTERCRSGLGARSPGPCPQAPAQCPVGTCACWGTPWHREEHACRRTGRRDRMGCSCVQTRSDNNDHWNPIVTRPKPSLPCTTNSSGLLENISKTANRSSSMHPGSAPNNAPGPPRSHRRQRVNSLRFAACVRRSSERTGSDDASPAGMMSRRPRSPYEMRWPCEWTLGLRQQSSTRRRARRPRTSRPHYASWHHEKPTAWDLSSQPIAPGAGT